MGNLAILYEDTDDDVYNRVHHIIENIFVWDKNTYKKVKLDSFSITYSEIDDNGIINTARQLDEAKCVIAIRPDGDNEGYYYDRLIEEPELFKSSSEKIIPIDEDTQEDVNGECLIEEIINTIVYEDWVKSIEIGESEIDKKIKAKVLSTSIIFLLLLAIVSLIFVSIILEISIIKTILPLLGIIISLAVYLLDLKERVENHIMKEKS